MSIATTITVDDHFARIQLSHGLVVAAAVEGHDQLIVLVPIGKLTQATVDHV